MGDSRLLGKIGSHLFCTILLVIFGLNQAFAQDKFWKPLAEQSQEEYLTPENLIIFKGKLVISDHREFKPTMQFGFWNGLVWEYLDNTVASDSGFTRKPLYISEFENGESIIAFKTIIESHQKDKWAYFKFDGKQWVLFQYYKNFPENYYGYKVPAQRSDTVYNILFDDSEEFENRKVFVSVQFMDNRELFEYPSEYPPDLKKIENEIYLVNNHIDRGTDIRAQYPILRWLGAGGFKELGDNELGCLPDDVLLYQGKLVAAGENYLGEEGGTIYRLVDSVWEAFGHPDFHEIEKIVKYKDELIAYVSSPGFDLSNEIWRYNPVLGWRLIDAPNNRFGTKMVVLKDEVIIEFARLVNPNGDTLYNMASLPLLNDVNFNPTANPDNYEVGNGTLNTLKVTANDTDMNQDYLLVSIISQPSNGTATVNSMDEIEYRADRTFTGTEEFEYRICDRGGLCDSTTVTLTVIEENSAPITAMDTVRLARLNETYQIDVLANDLDAEKDDLVLTTVSSPNFGKLEIINAGTLLSFNSGNSFWDVQTVEYTVCDEFNACSNEQLTLILDSTFVGMEGKENAQIIEARIYPNPAKDVVNIEVTPNQSHQLSGTLYSVQGRLIQQFNFSESGKIQLDIQSFSSGVYSIVISAGNGNQKVFKLVK